MDLGLSFMPSAQPNTPGTQGPVGDPTQEAVKILSLRLPKVVGGGAFAPGALFSGPGGQGNPFAQNAIGQTQQRLFLQPTAPLGGSAGNGSVSGAVSPGLGGIPPDLLARVLDLLTNGSLGTSTFGPSGRTPVPHLTLGDAFRNPNPYPEPPVPPNGPLPPNARGPEISPNQPSPPLAPAPPVPGGSGGRPFYGRTSSF